MSTGAMAGTPTSLQVPVLISAADRLGSLHFGHRAVVRLRLQRVIQALRQQDQKLSGSGPVTPEQERLVASLERAVLGTRATQRWLPFVVAVDEIARRWREFAPQHSRRFPHAAAALTANQLIDVAELTAAPIRTRVGGLSEQDTSALGWLLLGVAPFADRMCDDSLRDTWDAVSDWRRRGGPRTARGRGKWDLLARIVGQVFPHMLVKSETLKVGWATSGARQTHRRPRATRVREPCHASHGPNR
jgi:hypothetical protein